MRMKNLNNIEVLRISIESLVFPWAIVSHTLQPAILICLYCPFPNFVAILARLFQHMSLACIADFFKAP